MLTEVKLGLELDLHFSMLSREDDWSANWQGNIPCPLSRLLFLAISGQLIGRTIRGEYLKASKKASVKIRSLVNTKRGRVELLVSGCTATASVAADVWTSRRVPWCSLDQTDRCSSLCAEDMDYHHQDLRSTKHTIVTFSWPLVPFNLSHSYRLL